jgi:hypothetical protein
MGSCELFRRYRPAHPCKVQLDDGQVRFMPERAFEALFGVPFEPALALAAPRQAALRRRSEAPVPENPDDLDEPTATAPLDVEGAPGVLGLPRALWPREWAGGVGALGDNALATLGSVLDRASCALVGGTLTAAWRPADLGGTASGTLPSLEGAGVLTPLDSSAAGERTDALFIDIPLGEDTLGAVAAYLMSGTVPEEPAQTPAPAAPEGVHAPTPSVPGKESVSPPVVRARMGREGLPPGTWPSEWRLGTTTPPDPWCRGTRTFEEDVLRAVLVRGTPSMVGGTVCIRWSLPSLCRRFGRRGEGVASAVASLEVQGALERVDGDPSGTRTDRLFPGRRLSRASLKALEAYLARGRVDGEARAYSEPVRDPRVTCPPGKECWGVPASLRPASWSSFDGASLSEDAVKVIVWALCRARLWVVSGRVCAGIGPGIVRKAVGLGERESRAVIAELQEAGALGPRETSADRDGAVRGHNVRELFPELPVTAGELEEIEGAIRKGGGWGSKAAPMEPPRFLSPEAPAKTPAEPPAGVPEKAPAEPPKDSPGKVSEKAPTEPAAEVPEATPAEPVEAPAAEAPAVLVFDAAGTFCGRLSEDDCRAVFGESCEISGGVCRVLPQGAPAPTPAVSDDWSLARSQALALVAPALLPRVEAALEAVAKGDAGVAAEISAEVRGHPVEYRGSTAAAELMGAPVSPARLASRICHEAPYVALAVGALETLLERRGDADMTGAGSPTDPPAEAAGDVEGMCLAWAAAHTDDADLRRRHVARELSAGRWALLLFEEAAAAAALEAGLDCAHAPWDVTVVATEGFGATFAVALVETGGEPAAVALGDGPEEAPAQEAALAMAGLVCESGRRGPDSGPDGGSGEGACSGEAEGATGDGFIVCGQPARKAGPRGRLAHPRRSPRPHTVRGHWRNQACGPAWSEHRRIWVGQFDKGDTYAMGGGSRPNAGHRVWRVVMACGLSVVA